MNYRLNSFILLLALMQGCDRDSISSASGKKDKPFISIDTNFTTQMLLLPGGDIVSKVLFRQGDPVLLPDGIQTTPSRGRHDFLAYLPLNGSSSEGMLWTNHESLDNNDYLGDGGGATIMGVKMVKGEWIISEEPQAVDFSPVGGTVFNCLGGVTPWGTVLTSEEFLPKSNSDCFNGGKGIRDTSDYKGYKKYLNCGWAVEVDPVKKVAIRKLFSLGRFMHEGIFCMDDKKTVYLMDDYAPGIFFKFIATKSADLSVGQLFAYRQSIDGLSGNWISLPMERDSLNEIRNVAMRMGATIFIRLEDFELAGDGNFYLTETGSPDVDFSDAVRMGGIPAFHLKKFHTGNNIYQDPFGRILKFNPVNNQVTVFLEGGTSGETNLSNPDNLSIDNKRNFLIIQEDILEASEGRVPAHATGKLFSEIYFIDLSDPAPSIEKLLRFGIGPRGSETTGSCWTPDFNTMFFNIQHPDKDNVPEWNKACTVVVTGFK